MKSNFDVVDGLLAPECHTVLEMVLNNYLHKGHVSAKNVFALTNTLAGSEPT